MLKRMLPLLAVSLMLLPSLAIADIFNFLPSPMDLSDLDHHQVYTWRINGVNLGGKAIASARLTFTNIQNWDSNPNVLHLHLRDTAIAAGVASYVDDPTGSAPVTDLIDDFINSRYHATWGWVPTPDTFLTDKSFTTTPVTWSYDFSSTQIAALTSYITNGSDIALGFDPDCHFFNDKVKFQITTVPEPATSAVMGLLLAGVCYARRRRR